MSEVKKPDRPVNQRKPKRNKQDCTRRDQDVGEYLHYLTPAFLCSSDLRVLTPPNKAQPFFFAGYHSMMGKIVDPASSFVSKTTSAIVVLPEDSSPIVERSSSLERVFRIAKSVCDQCNFCTELCPRYLLGHKLRPHLMMRRVGFELSLSDSVLAEAHYCSECGICSLYACPLGISPRRVIMLLKGRYERPRTSRIDFESRPEYGDRRLPSSRLKTRLGVAHYDANPPKYMGKIAVENVSISLTQHVGVAARPCVKEGERVRKGSLIADVPTGALGAAVHASINGRVTSATADAIALSAK